MGRRDGFDIQVALDPAGAGAAFHELAGKVVEAMTVFENKKGPKITLED